MTETRFKMLTMQQHSKYRWVPLDSAVETVHEAMQPAIVIHKRDVLKDLPPVTVSGREVELTVEQKRLMRELRKDSQAQAAGGVQISAVHAAALRTKILQIASGTVYDDNNNIHEVDCKPRMDELRDIVQQVRGQDDGTGKPEHKVIVVCAFTHTVDKVAAELNKAGFNFAVMYGAVSLKRREYILDAMEADRTFDGVVAYPEVLSHGVTLTSCSTTVFFTPFDKAEVALQVQNRMDRPGQKQPMQIIQLSGCAAEDLLYERMHQRIEFHKEVVGSYSQFVDVL
jgi:SNF2 family DNA or RNA helicase